MLENQQFQLQSIRKFYFNIIYYLAYLYQYYSRKGEGVGAKTRQGFNIAGKTALGGAFVVQLTAVESWHTIIYTGAGAAQYDPDKKEILAGIAWKVGWMTKQGSYMNPWSPRFAVLRTYSISFYKDPKVMFFYF